MLETSAKYLWIFSLSAVRYTEPNCGCVPTNSYDFNLIGDSLSGTLNNCNE
ncbi:MAG: hypothetical protein KDC90_17970 [Ignavibacteriae bacterium]|nr:hypothetical protein [Ignavibacteriota bacterium]